MNKLSASALSCYLESPRKFYWQYVKRLTPLSLTTTNFDHDKICGQLWAEFVDRFYKGIPYQANWSQLEAAWKDQTEGWVGEKTSEKLKDAMLSWGNTYYQLFSPTDGIRTAKGSELFVENDRFLGFLDGISVDGVIHEVKSTSRAKSVSEQLQKVQSSIQIKLYAVLAQAKGIRIEFAWKDAPHGIYRSDILPVTSEQRAEWEEQLNALADQIYSMGDNPNNYICHSDGCSVITKNFCGICEYQPLCLGMEGAELAFKQRINKRTGK